MKTMNSSLRKSRLDENSSELVFGRASDATFLNIRDFKISEVELKEQNNMNQELLEGIILGSN